ADYRPGERITIRRNPYYAGKRPHHVDGFDVDLTSSTQQEVLDRIERDEADWGYVLGPVALEPGRGLVAKYGINKSQFFIKPGYSLRMLVFNSSRPLFKNNPKLRRAVNMALNRRAIISAVSSIVTDRLTDQYLPPDLPGFRNANIYPLDHANVTEARKLARGNLRGGKATFYVPNFPPPLAVAQAAKAQLAEIGLDVELKPIPFHITSSGYLGKLGLRDEPWDISLVLWTDVVDPYGYINVLFDKRFIGSTNLARFESTKYDTLMRQAARLQGASRYRAYGKLDVELARDAAPLAALGFLSESTLVSKRVGCKVLRPVLDLTTICLN
nr:ABC transporter substrate-binding protein [Actinomycetota bacterium]